MNLTIISYPKPLLIEFDIVFKLFEEGLEVFHLRKPGYSDKEMEHFLNRVPKALRSKITIHGHKQVAEKYELGGLHLGVNDEFGDWSGRKSRSFHSIEEIDNNIEELDYAFISPVFDSISKKNYKSKFDLAELKESIKNSKTPIYALGGVDEKSITNLQKGDFSGVAVLGCIWHTVRFNSLMDKFKQLQDYCKEN